MRFIKAQPNIFFMIASLAGLQFTQSAPADGTKASVFTENSPQPQHNGLDQEIPFRHAPQCYSPEDRQHKMDSNAPISVTTNKSTVRYMQGTKNVKY